MSKPNEKQHELPWPAIIVIIIAIAVVAAMVSGS